MKFQILIPQYKETDEDIRPLLDSIAIQQNVDFDDMGVVIVNDGTECLLSGDFLDSYPFHIDYYKGPHRGVSGARNACLDNAVADYVMWCDADDMFYNVCALHLIYKYIDIGFDAMNSMFYEEIRDAEGKPLYVKHENDASFVHGKVYRRYYLLEYDLRFNSKLTVHEDSYFNYLALNLAKNRKYCDTPFYLWRWRDASVCRRDPKYRYNTYDKLIESNDALVEELKRRGRMDEAMYFVSYMVFETYYTMHLKDWTSQENEIYRDMTETRFGEYILKWEHLWDAEERKVAISAQAREKVIKEGMTLETVTVFDWLEQCKEKHNGYKKSERTQTAGEDRVHEETPRSRRREEKSGEESGEEKEDRKEEVGDTHDLCRDHSQHQGSWILRQ